MPRRPILGIASDDSYLQSLIPFESTPDTARLGEFARASRASAKKGQSSEGDLPTSLTEMEVDRLQQQGKDAFLAQDLKKAVKLWGEALSKAAELNAPTPKKLQASRAAQLYANRCQAYLNLGDEKAALSDAEAAVAAAPGWPKAYYRHGTVLMRKKAYTKAYGIFKQGWHLDTSNLELTKACQKAREAMLEGDNKDIQFHPDGNTFVDRSKPKAGSDSSDVGSSSGGGAGSGSGGGAGSGSGGGAGSTAASDSMASTAPAAAAQHYRETAQRQTEEAAARAAAAKAAAAAAGAPPAASCAAAAATLPSRAEEDPARAAKRKEIEERVRLAKEQQTREAAPEARAKPIDIGEAPSPPLPLPEHTLLPDKDSGSLLLQVQLPLAKKSGDVDLAINEKCIEVEVAGVYRQLRVSIPERPAVSSSDAVARFDKHSKTLKVYLPPVA
jgi:tetratricopeptide (TPR) repeat protein